MSGPTGLRALFMGPARYEPRSPWGPLSAFLLTLLTLVGSLAAAVAGVAVSGLWAYLEKLLTQDGAVAFTETVLLGSSLMWIGCIWLLSGRRHMRRQTLALAKPGPPLWVSLVAAVIIVGLIALFDAAMDWIFKNGLADAETAVAGLRSPFWQLTIFTAVVTAPITEELIVRGFLLSALAQSRLGIIGGGLLSNTIWTLLHWGYSIPGLVSVFIMGLTLTWLVWRTGSIRPAIVVHAVNNVVAVVAIYFLYVPK